jgi:diguanylate cyclase (GGDEF)-like protein
MATILIVDERALNRELVTLLRDHGHRLLEAVDGKDVLEIVRAEKPDLVLTDILMPDPGGYQIVQHLRAEPGLVQPQVIFLAAASLEAEARELAHAHGVSNFLTTPVESGSLLAVINAALSDPRPPTGESRFDHAVIGAHLRRIAGKLRQRLGELERLNAQLNQFAAGCLEQLEVARSALGQEITKRLWAEKELTQTNLRLQDKAIRDALTGLYNRGYLEESLDREASRARRSNQPFGVMMIDIDHFKRCNDIFGHATGDAVLRTLGQYLLSLARGEDIPCRYGGEEFVLVMAHAAPATVRERAERLRLGVQELKIEHDGRSIGPITLSIGIALFPDHGESGQAVLQAADAAMYQAKQAGRNCIVAMEYRRMKRRA